MSELLQEPETFRDVLYTVDRHGRRRWVYSATVFGKFFRRRATVAYILLFIYLSGPWYTINGRQAFLLDVIHRRFTIFGVEFWATDTVFLMLVLASLGICLFFFTSLFGRIWCGWACPQTVYLEFLFRPIERLIEGGPAQRRRLDTQPWNREKILKKGLKGSIFLFFSWLIANTFLAFVYGARPVLEMMHHSPAAHPFAFGISIFIMFVVLFEFGWFREQFCTVLCPYARFQSVLLDRSTLVIGYDAKRGEPRGKMRLKQQTSGGDCVDCGACVRVCPTGIDIRNGLQLECINCAGCIDACNEIMRSVGKPEGLIRYDSEQGFAGQKGRILRPRVLVYTGVLLALLTTLATLLSSRMPFDADIVRRPMTQAYFTEPNGRIGNALFLELANKAPESMSFSVKLANPPSGTELVVADPSLTLPSGSQRTVPLIVNFPKDILEKGKRKVEILVSTPLGSSTTTVTLLGPDA